LITPTKGAKTGPFTILEDGGIAKKLVHHIFLEFNKKAAAPRGLNYR
jgi:hypothetical protein